MGMRSRRKGKSGELELSHTLRDLFGWSARRGQQRSGLDQQDVLVPELPGVLVECKRVEKLNLYEAMAKAIVDAKERIPAIFHRRNRQEWLVTIRLVDLARFAKEIHGATNGNTEDAQG